MRPVSMYRDSEPVLRLVVGKSYSYVFVTSKVRPSVSITNPQFPFSLGSHCSGLRMWAEIHQIRKGGLSENQAIPRMINMKRAILDSNRVFSGYMLDLPTIFWYVHVPASFIQKDNNRTYYIWEYDPERRWLIKPHKVCFIPPFSKTDFWLEKSRLFICRLDGKLLLMGFFSITIVTSVYGRNPSVWVGFGNVWSFKQGTPPISAKNYQNQLARKIVNSPPVG